MHGPLSARNQSVGRGDCRYADLESFLAGEFARIPAIDLLRRGAETPDARKRMLQRATIQGGIDFDELPFRRSIGAAAAEFLGTDRPVVKFFMSASPTAWGLHQDPQDMLVVQLLGSKLWRLGFPIVERRAETASIVVTPDRLERSGQSLVEQLLCAGDMLFLPRDTAHWVSYAPDRCAADAPPSVHLTLGRADPDLPPAREEVMVIFHD